MSEARRGIGSAFCRRAKQSVSLWAAPERKDRREFIVGVSLFRGLRR